MMMKKIICFILIVLTTSLCHAQDNASDYLRAGMNLIGKKDYTHAIETLKKVLPYADEATATTLNRNIGFAYFMYATLFYLREDNIAAKELYFKSLEYLEKSKDWKTLSNSLSEIATIYEYTSQTDSAAIYYDKAITAAQSIPSDVLVVDILNNKCNLYKKHEMYDDYLKSIAARDSITNHSKDDLMQILKLNDMADMAVKNKDHEKAIKIYKTVLDMISAHGDRPDMEDHVLTATIKLRDLYVETCDFEKAIEYGKKCISIGRRSPSITSDNILAYNSMARIYAKTGNREMAFKYADSTFMIHNEITPTNVIGRNYFSRGLLHAQFKEWNLALSDFLMADSIFDEGPCDIYFKKNANIWLSTSCYNLGRFDDAVVHSQKYADLCASTNGKQSEEYIWALQNMANIKAFAGDIAGGGNDYINATEQRLISIRDNYLLMPEAEREIYFNKLASNMVNMTAFGLAAGFHQNEFTKTSYNAVLVSKGFLLASEKSLVDIIKSTGDSELKQLYNQLVSLKDKISETEAEGRTGSTEHANLYNEKSVIDSKLTRKCSDYYDITGFMDVNHDSIQSAISDRDVIIDFTDFQKSSGAHLYIAYVINKNQEFPLMVNVCDGRKIDSIMNIEGDGSYLYKGVNAAALTDICMGGLLEHIDGYDNVYFIPSGIYHKIAVEALPLPDGSILGDKYNIIRLSTARELCTDGAHMPSIPVVELFGGLVYDMDKEEIIEESSHYDIADLLAVRGDTQHGDAGFDELKLSLKEVNQIEDFIKGKAHVSNHKGKKGTVAAFAAMSGKSPDIIHIATHGFYFDPGDKRIGAGLKGYSDAMRLSGLVMSGGNAEWLGQEVPQGTLGGLLTANIISQLDLNNTRLVSLAACNTGMGKVTPEGVYGLQRAFKKAGVKTIVMSLWSASEVSTTLFMTEFYKNLASNGWDCRNAFKTAQNTVREQFPDPFYWAGFIMMD